MKKLCEKIKYLIRSINNNLDDYDEKHMKIKCNSNDDLPLKKALGLDSIILVAMPFFHKS